MSEQEILKAAVAQAVASGYEAWWVHHVVNPDLTECIEDDVLYWVSNKGEFSGMPIEDNIPVYSVVFNHDFAKVLWGDDTISCYECTEGGHSVDHGYEWGKLAMWQYHLQQMVIADDPIKYLGEHLDG